MGTYCINNRNGGNDPYLSLLLGLEQDQLCQDKVHDFLASIFHFYAGLSTTYFKTPRSDQSTVLHLSEQS